MRFVVSPEWKLGQALDEAILKTFSGGDRVSARFLHQEMFQFNPVCKIVLASNHKPIVKGTDHGIWRRMRLVPFLAKFEDAQGIKDLDKLLIAEEGPAILRWAVEGAQLWASQGLHTPATISEATAEYRNTQDWFLTFLEERCDVQTGASVASQLIYNDYKNWCLTSGIRFPIKQTAFNERLVGHKFQKKATKFANLWMGLKLKTGPHIVHTSDDGVAMSMQPDQDSRAGSIVVGDLNFGL
jgi:putative DNA primase/helicase